MRVISAPRVVADGVPLGPAVRRGRGTAWSSASPRGRRTAGAARTCALPTGVLVPGLVDIQVNGCFGVDFVAADPAGWAEAARRLPETGVTAFLPTFITAPVPELVAALRGGPRRCRRCPAPGCWACTSRGRSCRRAGTARTTRRCCGTPPRRASTALLGAAPGLLRIHTLAPELPGALDAIRRLTAAGVLVSIGHSDATAAQAEAAADAGARLVTHLFNAMRPLHHREPGVVGQALADPRLTCGLIADLHHVAAPVCRLAFAAAAGRVVLVTDAVAAAGMPPGTYDLGGQQVSVGPARPAAAGGRHARRVRAAAGRGGGERRRRRRRPAVRGGRGHPAAGGPGRPAGPRPDRARARSRTWSGWATTCPPGRPGSPASSCTAAPGSASLVPGGRPGSGAGNGLAPGPGGRGVADGPVDGRAGIGSRLAATPRPVRP